MVQINWIEILVWFVRIGVCAVLTMFLLYVLYVLFVARPEDEAMQQRKDDESKYNDIRDR